MTREASRRPCPLCDHERVPDDAYAQAFEVYGSAASRGLRDRAAAAVIARADLVGEGVEVQEVWSHFAQHDRRQPRPPGNLKRAKALAASERLSVRQREVLTLVGRLGAVSAQQIWQALYEDQLATANAARAACYRELRPLVFGHFLYRARPPRGFGLEVRPEARLDGLTFYHPGRDMIPFMEDSDGLTPAVVADAREVDEDGLREVHAATQVVLGLRRELYGAGPDLGVPAALRLSPGNWFGAAQSAIWFHHPTRGRLEQVAPDGLAALSLLVPSRGVDTLLPFFYLHDPGYLPVEVIAERLVVFGGLRISGAVAGRFPALGRHVPPVVVVTSSPKRQQDLAAALRGRGASLSAPERPTLIASDRTSIRGRAFSAKVWSSLWDGDDPEGRVTLLRALLAAPGPRAHEEGLRASTQLRAEMTCGARPSRIAA